MFILYRLAAPLTIDRLIEAAATDGVGHEADFNSTADFIVRADQEAGSWAEAQLEAKASRQVMGAVAPAAFGRRHYGEEGVIPFVAVWVTAWSRYRYGFVDDRTVVYEGAQSGWRVQSLLPPELQAEPGEVLAVWGTYGLFSGAQALERYAARKAAWEGAIAPFSTALFDGDYQRRPSWVAAKIWEGLSLSHLPGKPDSLLFEIAAAYAAAIEGKDAPPPPPPLPGADDLPAEIMPEVEMPNRASPPPAHRAG